MTSLTAVLDRSGITRALPDSSRAIRLMVPVGRFFFSALFLAGGLSHFSPSVIGFAAQQGVPFAEFLVPASGLLALAGGLSVLLGYHARVGAALLVLFLVPITLTMHAFWTIEDPMTAQMQQAMFMKNLAMLGGALLVGYFGAGPLSLDARRKANQERLSGRVAQQPSRRGV